MSQQTVSPIPLTPQAGHSPGASVTTPWERPVRRGAITVGALLAAVALGQMLAGDDPFGVLDAYRQPWFALSDSGWITVGALYYLLMGGALYRLLRMWPQSRTAVALVVAVMLANEAVNVWLFGGAPWGAFIALVVFAGLVALTFAVARRHDRVSSGLLGLYLLWVVGYDIPWTLSLAVLN